MSFFYLEKNKIHTYVFEIKNKKRIKMQKFITYFTSILFTLFLFYLLFWLWWLLLPVFLVGITFALYRIYRIKKIWNDLLKQNQPPHFNKEKTKKVSDDKIIDVDFEEIK